MGVVTDQKVTQEKVLPYQQHCSPPAPTGPQHPEANLSELSIPGSTRWAKLGSAVGVLQGGGTDDEQAMQGAEQDTYAELDASSKDQGPDRDTRREGCPKPPKYYAEQECIGSAILLCPALEPFAVVVVVLIVIIHAQCSNSSNTRGYAMRSKSSS